MRVLLTITKYFEKYIKFPVEWPDVNLLPWTICMIVSGGVL